PISRAMRCTVPLPNQMNFVWPILPSADAMFMRVCEPRDGQGFLYGGLAPRPAPYHPIWNRKRTSTVVVVMAPGGCASFVTARIQAFDLDQIQGCHARTTLNVRHDGQSFVPLF